MLEIYSKAPKDAEFEQIKDFRSGSFIYAKETRSDDLNAIATLTGLDLLEIRDSLDRFELPRIERIGDNTLFFLRHPSEVEYGLYTNTLTIILANSCVIAISPDRSEIIEQILSGAANVDTAQRSKLILYILLKISQDYTNHIKQVRHATLGQETTARLADNESIALLTKNEEILNQFLTSLVPMRNTLKVLSDGRYMTMQKKDNDLLQDLLIGIYQSEDICSINIKSIRSLRDSYQIIFTNKVNQTIKVLTALTIFFHIPTLVASIYGMNIATPFQHSPFAFAYYLFIIVIAVIIAFLLFRRNRWL